MKVENVKGIVWDLDGTLIDSFGIYEQIITDIVQEHGHQMPSREFMLHNYHGSLEESIARILGIDSPSEVARTVDIFLGMQGRFYAGDLESHLFQDASKLAQRESG